MGMARPFIMEERTLSRKAMISEISRVSAKRPTGMRERTDRT
jgi:hypothetical protein